MKELKKHAPLYTERQRRETMRILEEKGYLPTVHLSDAGILNYANPDTGENVVVTVHSPQSRYPMDGLLTFFPSGKIIGMWDFVAQENVKAASPGLPRLIKRIAEAILKF